MKYATLNENKWLIKLLRRHLKIPRILLVGIPIFLLCLWIALGPVASYVSAAPLPDSELQALNEWPNWVPDACSSSTSSSTSSSSSSGVTPGPVYIMGDSITALAQTSYVTKFTGGGWTPTINGLVSRQIATTPPSPDGLGQIDQDKATIAKSNAIVIALGTNSVNQQASTTKSQVLQALDKIEGYDSQKAPIFWVNVMDSLYLQSSGVTNTAIGDAITAFNNEPNQQITASEIDWFSEAQANADYKNFNLGVHPTSQHDIDLLVNLVYDSVNNGSSGGSSSSTSGCCSDTTSFGTGTLPSSVPSPYNSIFTAAAKKYNVPPAFLAGIFYGGEHGNSFPDPPPPYGHGGPWASSGVASSGSQDWPTQPPGPGAAGPFQFEYPTWQSNGVSASGKGGAPDVEDLIDASFGAAHLLAALGATTTKTGVLHNAAAAYNAGSNIAAGAAYADAVMLAYAKFGGSSSGSGSGGVSSSSSTSSSDCSSTTTSGGGGGGTYSNPFPQGWQPGRLDMGYDGHFTSKIVSPCDGSMIYVIADANHGSNGGWEGAYIVVKCSAPITGLASDAFYFAEGILPTVKLNQVVKSGEQIAVPGWTNYAQGPGGIEWGLADANNPGNTLAESGVNGLNNCSAASATMVLAFTTWAEQNLQLAAPSSTDHAGCA